MAENELNVEDYALLDSGGGRVLVAAQAARLRMAQGGGPET
jgi:hypothetical protein